MLWDIISQPEFSNINLVVLNILKVSCVVRDWVSDVDKFCVLFGQSNKVKIEQKVLRKYLPLLTN